MTKDASRLLDQCDGKQLVKGMTVRSIMDTFGFSFIDVLKIDIEGAEKEVFADTSEWISNVNSLIVELHEGKKPGCKRSFYNGTNGFEAERHYGENVFSSRPGWLAAPCN